MSYLKKFIGSKKSHILEEVSWFIAKKLSSIVLYDDENEMVAISDEYLDTVVLSEPFTLSYRIYRSLDETKVSFTYNYPQSEDVTRRELLQMIYNFYHGYAPLEQLISQSKMNEDCKYTKMAINALKNNKHIKRYKFMGGMMYFEGLERVCSLDPNDHNLPIHFIVALGS